MPLTKEQRIELLAKAREAKKAKAAATKGEMTAAPKAKTKKVDIQPEPEVDMQDDFEPEPVKKVRKPRAKKEPVRTLVLNDELKVEDVNVITDDTIIEEVIEVRKKPKKKIVKKIVYESNSDDEIEEVVEIKAKPKKEPTPVNLQKPREVDLTQSTASFNFFAD
jgi:hypothetical protein